MLDHVPVLVHIPGLTHVPVLEHVPVLACVPRLDRVPRLEKLTTQSVYTWKKKQIKNLDMNSGCQDMDLSQKGFPLVRNL